MAKNKIDYNSMPLDMNFRQNLQSGNSMQQAPTRQDSVGDISASATKGVKNKVYQQKQRVVSDTKTANARKAAEDGKLNFYYNNNDSLTPEAVKVGLERGMLSNVDGQLYRMEKDANGNLIRNTLPIANYSEDGNVVPKVYNDLGSGESFDAKARITPEQIRQREAMQDNEARRGRAMGMTRGMGAGPNSGSAWDNAYASGLLNSGLSTITNLANIAGGGQNEMAGMSDYSQNYEGQTAGIAKKLGNANGEVAKTLAIPAGAEVGMMKGVGQIASAIPKFAKAAKFGAHFLAPAAADAGYEAMNSLARSTTGRISADEASEGIAHEGTLGAIKGAAHALHLPRIAQLGIQAYADGAAVLHRAGPTHISEESSIAENRLGAPSYIMKNQTLAENNIPAYVNNPYITQPKRLPMMALPQQTKGV